MIKFCRWSFVFYGLILSQIYSCVKPSGFHQLQYEEKQKIFEFEKNKKEFYEIRKVIQAIWNDGDHANILSDKIIPCESGNIDQRFNIERIKCFLKAFNSSNSLSYKFFWPGYENMTLGELNFHKNELGNSELSIPVAFIKQGQKARVRLSLKDESIPLPEGYYPLKRTGDELSFFDVNYFLTIDRFLVSKSDILFWISILKSQNGEILQEYRDLEERLLSWTGDDYLISVPPFTNYSMLSMNSDTPEFRYIRTI